MPTSPRRSSSRVGRTLVTTGAVLSSTYVGLSLARRWYQQTLPPSLAVPSALDLTSRPFEAPDGRGQYYVRPGTGTPVVLLHSINAAASSFEMKPVAEHMAATTDRPIYALDWLGFGRSDRPALKYAPAVYEHQLYHFLKEVVDTPADLVALSLGGEYAAKMALQAAPSVRRLVLISPTGLSVSNRRSRTRRLALSLAARTGVFEMLFYRWTRPQKIRRFYEEQVFHDPNAVPSELVEYASVTAHAQNAHHAPRRFVEGRLFIDDVAERIYSRLYRPTLLVTPTEPTSTIQRFDLLPTLLERNERDLFHRSVPGGLLPQWEAPTPFFDVLSTFLS